MNYKDYRFQIKYYDNGWVNNWFSNMTKVDIEIDGKIYKSTENYYQSQKLENWKDRLYIADLDPHISKKEVRNYNIRKDWDDVKIDVMKKALIAKFTKPYWKTLLLSTDNEPIIEWNNWNDKFWGVSVKDNKGQNHLGNLLMDIREEFKYKSLF